MKRRSKAILHALLAAGGGLLVLMVFCRPAEGSLAECIDATCRISTPDGSRGTGCAFENSQGYVFVLTAAHVVGTHQTVQCEFWRRGHQSVPLPAEVIARNESADAAVVCLPVGSFRGIVPPCIPVAPRDSTLSQGEAVMSVGCARGAWATGFKGHVVDCSGGSTSFAPPPADGRSGSALFDAEGEKIIGVIWGRSDAEGRGYAVTVQDLYRALNFRKTASGWQHSPRPLVDAGPALAFEVDILQNGLAQNGPCGPGGCPTEEYLLPYRDDQQQRDSQRDRMLDELDRRLDRQEQVWPTLPPQDHPSPNAVQRQPNPADVDPEEQTAQQADGRIGGLGVGLALAAAVGVGGFLFYVLGKQ